MRYKIAIQVRARYTQRVMILALGSNMHQYLEHEYDDEWNTYETPDKKGEIIDILKDQWEILKKQAIEKIRRITERYYETDKGRNYSKDVEDFDGNVTEYGDDKYKEHLYTMIKYQGKDTLIYIGKGEFSHDVFTRRNIPTLRWFSHSPLPLFVVAAWADEEYKEQRPKQFLDEHAMIYSPRWWQAEVRTHPKQREKSIDYGNGSGSMQYENAILAVQNAGIHKMFQSKKSFEKFVRKMKEIKTYTPEKMQIRSRRNNREGEMFYDMMRTCLFHLSDGDMQDMYTLIQSFDIHKWAFTHIYHF